MSEYDVIFHWGELHAWLGSDWRKAFSKDTQEITMPMGASMSFEAYAKTIDAAYGTNPNTGKHNRHYIHNALIKRGLARSGIRVGVIGFSQTCIGAAVLLASPDGGAIDFVFANDGIHRTELPVHSADGSVSNKPVWAEYGKMAAFGHTSNTNTIPTERMLVISHSATPAPGKNIPSTTETASTIAKMVLQDHPIPAEFVDIPDLKDTEHDPPIRIKCGWGTEVNEYDRVPGLYTTKVGGFMVFGYSNKPGTGCTDHIYQSKVIGPRVMQHVIVPRWNQNPRGSGSCVVM